MVSRDVIERLIDSGDASVLDAPAPALARTAGIITLRRGELGAAAEHLLREVRQEFEASSSVPLSNKKNL